MKEFVLMRRVLCSLPTAIRYTNPSGARWVGTMVPKKPANDDTPEVHFEKELTGSVVTFSKPPPTPPYLGPLILLSLLDAWSKRDKDEG